MNGDVNRTIVVKAEHYPVLLSLPTYAGPLLFELPDCPRQAGIPWHTFLRLDPAVLLAHYDAEEYAPTSIDAHAFARMIMKVSHGLAVATYGLGNFDAFLPEYILGQKKEYLTFVGTSRNSEDEKTHDHVVKVADFGDSPRRWIVAHINLFSRFGAPGYRVIVGQHHGFDRPSLLVPQPPFESFAYASHLRLMIRFADEHEVGWSPIVAGTIAPNFKQD